MVIEIEFRQDVGVLRLIGKFTTGGEARLLRTKLEELRNAGYKKVLADLSEVPYLDSTGIGFLAGAYTTCQNRNGQFAIANLNPQVEKALEITNLLEVIPHYRDEESALKALEGPRGGR